MMCRDCYTKQLSNTKRWTRFGHSMPLKVTGKSRAAGKGPSEL